MNLNALLCKIKCLRTTVHGEYGKGLRAWSNFIYYSLFRINTFCIYGTSLETHQEINQDLPGVTFLTPTFDELNTLRIGKNLPREFFCDQFHKVSQCYIAQVEGEVAYIHWIYRSGDFSRFLKLGTDSAEINYVITLPQFRGRGISSAAFNFSMQELKKQGIKNVFAVIHDENVASIKSFVRAGFVEFGNTVSIGPFNRKKSF